MEALLKISAQKKAWQLIKEADDELKEGDASISKNIVIFLLIMEMPNLQILKN